MLGCDVELRVCGGSLYLTDGQTSGRTGRERAAVSIKVTAIQSKSSGKLDLLEQNNRRERRAFYICSCVPATQTH